MTETGLSGNRDFANRVVLVTGAAGGIGQATTRLLGACGARLVLTDLGLARESRADCWQRPLDVTDPHAVAALIEEVERDFGPVAHLAHLAGTLLTGDLTTMADSDWRRLFAVNCDGVFHVGRAVGAQMQNRRAGSIVVVASNAAGIPRAAGMGAYAASKAAAAMFTRCLGLELAPFGVRCNMVAPGSTRTPMLTGLWSDDAAEARVIAGDPAAFRTGIPLGKIGTPDDVAQAIAFLLSDKAGHITMADLYVDGGATLRA